MLNLLVWWSAGLLQRGHDGGHSVHILAGHDDLAANQLNHPEVSECYLDTVLAMAMSRLPHLCSHSVVVTCAPHHLRLLDVALNGVHGAVDHTADVPQTNDYLNISICCYLQGWACDPHGIFSGYLGTSGLGTTVVVNSPHIALQIFSPFSIHTDIYTLGLLHFGPLPRNTPGGAMNRNSKTKQKLGDEVISL